jgi:hypothetical protein
VSQFGVRDANHDFSLEIHPILRKHVNCMWDKFSIRIRPLCSIYMRGSQLIERSIYPINKKQIYLTFYLLPQSLPTPLLSNTSLNKIYQCSRCGLAHLKAFSLCSSSMGLPGEERLSNQPHRLGGWPHHLDLPSLHI